MALPDMTKQVLGVGSCLDKRTAFSDLLLIQYLGFTIGDNVYHLKVPGFGTELGHNVHGGKELKLYWLELLLEAGITSFLSIVHSDCLRHAKLSDQISEQLTHEIARAAFLASELPLLFRRAGREVPVMSYTAKIHDQFVQYQQINADQKHVGSSLQFARYGTIIAATYQQGAVA